MNLLVGFVATAGLSLVGPQATNSPDVREGIDRLKSVFAAVGVRGPIKTGPAFYVPARPAYRGVPMPPYADVNVTERSGATQRCIVGIGGKVNRRISVMESDTEKFDDLYPRVPFHDARLEKRVTSWVKRLAGKEAVRLDSVLIDHSGKRAVAYFTLVKNGRSFFGDWMTYGYTITFTVPEARFVAMEAHERPPEVDPRPASISAERATGLAKRQIDFLIRPNFTYAFTGRKTLGYLQVEPTAPAHLAWCIALRVSPILPASERGRIRAYTARAAVGDSFAYIDAVTGRFLKATDGYLAPMAALR